MHLSILNQYIFSWHGIISECVIWCEVERFVFKFFLILLKRNAVCPVLRLSMKNNEFGQKFSFLPMSVDCNQCAEKNGVRERKRAKEKETEFTDDRFVTLVLHVDTSFLVYENRLQICFHLILLYSSKKKKTKFVVVAAVKNQLEHRKIEQKMVEK